MKMEGTEDNNIQLAKDVLGSEPYVPLQALSCVGEARLPAVRTVERAKIWQYADHKKA